MNSVKMRHKNGLRLVCLYDHYKNLCAKSKDGKYTYTHDSQQSWIDEYEKFCNIYIDGEKFFLHNDKILKAFEILVGMHYLKCEYKGNKKIISLDEPFDLCPQEKFDSIVERTIAENKLTAFEY